MRQIREALRLHLQVGLTYSEVARALKLSKSAVGKYVSQARVAGVDWAVAQTLTDVELEGRLYRPPVPRASDHLAPDFAAIHQELKRPGVTLMLLWEEYAQGNALAYKYTSFCVKYRAWAQTVDFRAILTPVFHPRLTPPVGAQPSYASVDKSTVGASVSPFSVVSFWVARDFFLGPVFAAALEFLNRQLSLPVSTM